MHGLRHAVEAGAPPNPAGTTLGIGDEDVATFVRLEHGLYRDGVRFDNGRSASLQELGPGVRAYLIDDMRRPVPVTPEVEAVLA